MHPATERHILSTLELMKHSIRAIEAAVSTAKYAETMEQHKVVHAEAIRKAAAADLELATEDDENLLAQLFTPPTPKDGE